MNTAAQIKAAEEWGRAFDLQMEWWITSWDLKDEDKEIALLYMKKAEKEQKKLAERLCELCQK